MSDKFDIKVGSRDSVPSQEEFYNDSYVEGKSDSQTYVKVDFNGTGKDVSGNNSSWNKSGAPWKETEKYSRQDYTDKPSVEVTMGSDTPYPYE
jgi:hypothetical protein